jgi:MFS family permease
VVVASAVGLGLATLHPIALGVLMQPLSTIFHWSRAQLSASLLIVCTCVALFGPLVGHLADKFSPRRVALFGIFSFSLAVASVGLAGPSIWTWYFSWVAVGLAYPSVGPLLWTYGVNRWFDRGRGFALAVALCGVGIANFVAPMFVVACLERLGWRAVFFGIGVIGIFIVIPVTWLLFWMPISARPASGEETPKPATVGMSVSQILRSGAFWALAVAMLLVSAAIGTLLLHLQPIMRDAGLSMRAAAGYAALGGLAQIAGRLFVGQLLDRVPARWVGVVFFALPGAACGALLHYSGGTASSVFISVVIGLSVGAEVDLMAYLAGRYFGLRNYGVCYGLLFGFWSLGFGVAPVLAGAVFDANRNYSVMLLALMVGLGLSSLLVGVVKPPMSTDISR